jgi:polyisoprenoid-binding protein YceI
MIKHWTALGVASLIATGAIATQQPVFATGAAATAVQALPAPDVRAGAYRLDRAHAKILWTVSHFGFSEYTGEFTDFDATLTLDPAHPERSRLSVTVETPSIDGHNPALETHLRSADFFDVANHPRATFTSTLVRRTGASTAAVTGDFTLRGQTRPLTLDVTFNRAGDNMGGVYTAGFSATGTIRRSEFGMTYAVPGVSDEVQLRISGEFNPAS